jgi:hypothetical protein
VLAAGPLSAANLALLQEIAQIDELIGKCETDMSSLTAQERATVDGWLHSRDRFTAEAAAVRAHLAADLTAAAAAARTEAALQVENRMLLEQNEQLRRDLAAAQTALRLLRVTELAERPSARRAAALH